LIKSWQETQSGYSDLLLVLDDDDKELKKYPKNVLVRIGPRVGLSSGCNLGVKLYPDYKYYASAGDDHRFKTKGWDKMMIDKIKKEGGVGIAYGDDLLQGNRLPTAVVMSANIIEAMGYMIPPSLKHLRIDVAFRALGLRIQKLFYMPEIIIEHLHPAAKKAEWDEGYLRVNSTEMVSHDSKNYVIWAKEELPIIAKKIYGILNKR